ncbi:MULTISPECIES: 1-acylglycerol-3-phosphate O-acyltransferase [unclassified Motilimonas]|uniref:1-acylglycerol-3-phosphate O-acyltransferase n=1 Tax=Motilimonas TaxID=1914248 RepID=UPI001E34859B|nr:MULTISPECIES: 1-acylglycerol-3-phosphate O-acyltransferase [unclassified Motilimonas]MCE0557849.1 1-acylglycerol-3-phosphate O-acyltransferase [Motilimonas sp. E26]MDO6525613.1 1-acylglycerol-3-phosphate O-acyltransferase [Motilimonas sp. 1_MG-2023]
MLLILRGIFLSLFFILVSIFGSLWSLLRPRNPKNCYRIANLLAKSSRFMGINLVVRMPENAEKIGPAVHIANHQNNYDMVTLTAAVLPNVVSIGKKSLVWIPFFGPLYWLTGNILLDRDNRGRAVNTINTVANKIKQGHLSVMMFPEGTRSRGRGLMKFKTGAFHTAIQAGVPIVPTVVSDTHDQVKWNRWNNGEVIVEMLEPIDTTGYNKENVRELMALCQQRMEEKYQEISAEAHRHGDGAIKRDLA